ncbi:MAG: FAD-dependent oxidoreductase [Clostridiales bacterium]|jgi:glycine/D-amino acid oxidase-like deaminating enzyme/nitrite reductase/ring-hydroxylating ferredoxin subunit|nr:FAD-dependent oxidoreductase [Clostridiales bacterium]
MGNRQNVSLWMETSTKKSYPKLQRHMSVDAAVIGGGLAGITVAYLLKRQGLSTCVLEAREIGGGVTGNTTAKITAQHGLKLDSLIKKNGLKAAKQYAEVNSQAIGFMEKLALSLNIDCDFKRTFSCIITEDVARTQDILKEAEAAQRLGIEAEYYHRPSFEATRNADIKAAVKFFNQAQFHPLKYLYGVAEGFHDGTSCNIYEGTRATDIEKGKVNKVITEEGLVISAKYVVVATHFPFFDKRNLYFTKLYPERSYVMSFIAEEGFSEGMYKTAEEGFSLRTHALEDGRQLILLAGGYHRTGSGCYMMKNYLDLEKTAQRLFTVKESLWKWSAQDYSTPDGLPYAGQIACAMPNVFVMTGFDKWGMTNSTAAAMVISDFISSGYSPYLAAYNPLRPLKSFASFFTYLGKNIATMGRLIGGRLSRLPSKAIVKKGEARLINMKGVRTGVYRDEEGKVHVVKAVCSHMGCQLKFNDAEKTWDCPCHGSRYDLEGKVIEAPTKKALTRIEKGNFLD